VMGGNKIAMGGRIFMGGGGGSCDGIEIELLRERKGDCDGRGVVLG
jgi:hypothetical protein